MYRKSLLERIGFDMVNWKERVPLGKPSSQTLYFIFLLIAGVMEFLFITLESAFSYLGYYLTEDYLIVPCLLFLGVALSQDLTLSAKQKLGFSIAAVLWFSIVQFQHKLSQMGTHPIATFFFIYLMAFPYAAVAKDEENNRGMKLIGKLMTAASLVLVAYTVMLYLDCVPAPLEPYVFFDIPRLHVLWHPNITACFFMIGIGFSLSFLFTTAVLWKRILLIIAVALQFIAMALTNCRTSILMTCALIAGTLFFRLCWGSWKRVIAGILVAVALIAGLFSLSGKAYDYSALLQYNYYVSLWEQELDEANITDQEVAVEIDEFMSYGENVQGTLTNDLRTLNGRTGIWKAALSALRDNPSLLLWGTEYPGPAISWYNSFDVVHAHNSWFEAVLRLGLPGLAAALYITWVTVRSALVLLFSCKATMEKKVVAMLGLCLLVAGFLEPYLFITNVYYHTTDFMLFFCAGYLDQWRKQLSNSCI